MLNNCLKLLLATHSRCGGWNRRARVCSRKKTKLKKNSNSNVYQRASPAPKKAVDAAAYHPQSHHDRTLGASVFTAAFSPRRRGSKK